MRNKIQLISLVAVVLYFAATTDFLVVVSVIYGGFISFANVWLLARHLNKQEQQLWLKARAIVNLMYLSVVVRLSLVIGLVLLGYFVLNLSPVGVSSGLVAGQIGFILDSIKGSGFNKGYK